MPKGRPEPFAAHDVTAIVECMRQRHEGADDQELELLPAPDDLYGVLRYFQQREDVLEKPVERLEARLRQRLSEEEQERAQQALQAARDDLQAHGLDRVQLIRRMHQLLDVQEVSVLEACFRAGLKGREIGAELGIESRGGAALRLKRLRLAIKSKWQVRTPRVAQEQAEQEERERRRVASKHRTVRAAALNLLSSRASFVVLNEEDDWWEDLEDQVDGNDRSATQQAALAAKVRLLTAAIRSTAQSRGVSPASDVEAMRCLDEAETAAARA